MTDRKFYITTTLPYVNADPHIGFALEIVQADAIARYRRTLGDDIFFNTGTDEHGIKIYRKALEEKKEVQAYVDEYAARFDNLKGALNLSYNNFIRTTDEHHVYAAGEFWKRCAAAGDIYKKNYQSKYCAGCELEKTDSELENGKCPLHPKQEIELIDEENYFFRFSKYQEALLDLYKKNPDFVLPASRLHEITTFVSSGLTDFSISRLKEKMPWGVPVPDDSAHVMYVWFDALVNYLSALGWPEKENVTMEWWPGLQVAGKDNLRQQSAMWQAMLLSAGLPHSKQILIHGFVTSEGKKMSKSTGNVVNPISLVEKYGTDALRHYLLANIPTFEDGDFTEAKFLESYNANLANGLGNLVSRVVKMAVEYFGGNIIHRPEIDVPLKQRFETVSGTEITDGSSIEHTLSQEILPKFHEHMNHYEIHKACEVLWGFMKRLDGYVTDYEPYRLVKTDKNKTEAILWNLLYGIHCVSEIFAPIIPDASERIQEIINVKVLENGGVGSFLVKPVDKPLFLRK
jgi:methionyl-tRNA synthetase